MNYLQITATLALYFNRKYRPFCNINIAPKIAEKV